MSHYNIVIFYENATDVFQAKAISDHYPVEVKVLSFSKFPNFTGSAHKSGTCSIGVETKFWLISDTLHLYSIKIFI